MMNHILALSFMLFAIGQDNSSFQPGQSVYIVAKTTNTTIDLRAEVETRSEFEKQKKFKISNSAASADFVVFVLTEYEPLYSSEVLAGNRRGAVESRGRLKAAIVLAIPSKEYAEHKDDPEKLREVSLWQSMAYLSFSSVVSLPKLVRDFHKNIEKK
jgi:hypothetical protein